MGLIPCRLDLRCKSSWILNGFFTGKNIFKFVAANFGGIGMCLLVLLERSWWAGF
jgi:hypothetical protein